MKGPQRVFAGAAIYGALTLPPMYFMEARIAREAPPAVTHPEFFYGFISVGLACQVMFAVIALDPKKYRLFMIPAMVEKFGYAATVFALAAAGRVAMPVPAFAGIDLLLGLSFAWAFTATR